ncbi:MAG: hypothetical protein JSU68_07015 [Phycisphaerales bacterium]|nr:MAG: hypothetical protein JSU68_07015 [Phycisphaerales bacterium]
MAGAGESHAAEAGGGSRGWRRLGIVLAILLALVFLPWLFLSVTGRAAVRNRLALMKAAGEPTSLAEYEARRPVIPDEENSALIILSLADELEQLAKEHGFSRTLPVLGRADMPPWGEPWPREIFDAVEGLLAQQVELVAELDSIRDLPDGRFPLNLMPNPLAILLPYLSPLRTASKVQSLGALHDAAIGKHNRSLDHCRTVLNMGASVRDDPVLISALVSIAIDALAVDTLERVLSFTTADAEQISALQRLLRDHEINSPIPNGLRGERLFTLELFEYVARNGPQALAGVAAGDNAVMSWPRALHFLFGGWIRLNEAKAMELTTSLIDALDSPRTAMDAAAIKDQALASLGLEYFLVKHLTPSLSRSVILWARSVAGLRCAQAGLAAERFRLATGRWPESLEELVPEYLDAVPLDPFDEKPLRYRVEADRVVIYSIGEDEVDDGGQLVHPERRKETPPDAGFRLLNPELRGFKIEQAEQPQP